MMPAAKHGDPQMGVDVHLCVVPPSPSPVPLPTPHMSIVFDPFDYVPVLGASVTVCGMKRATAGTNGTVVHIPPGFPFAPKLPDKDDELFMGSSTVVADGDPFSFIGVPALGCQVAGMISIPRLKKKGSGKKAMLLPTTFNLAIPSTVFVGGPPTISLMGLAMKGLFSALGKFAKSKLFKKFRQKLFGHMKPGFLKCVILRAEPVNILTGEVSVEQEDFTLPGRIPIEWVRSYSSSSARKGVCGYGWETPADGRLEVDPLGDTVLMQYPLIGPLSFSRLPVTTGQEAAELELMDGALLTDSGAEYRVRTKQDRVYHFSKELVVVRDDGTREFPLVRISDLCGNWLEVERRANQFVGIRESAGRRIWAEIQDERLMTLALATLYADTAHPLMQYHYDATGDLVAAIDATGQPYRFHYNEHHLTQHTDRNGQSFYYQYETGPEGDWRVRHAWGDGGLYDYRFDYLDLLNERRIQDSLGYVSLIKLDERGLPISEIDALGGTTIYEYDEVGRTVGVIDPGGLRTGFTYDDRGNLLILTKPNGDAIQTEYDDANRPVVVTDAAGGVWRQDWDGQGLVRQQITPLGYVLRYEYDDLGQLIRFTNARGGRMELEVDAFGNVLLLRNALGDVTRFSFDVLGNLLSKTDALGDVTRYSYDVKNRLTTMRLPSGATIRCSYDAEDNLTRHVDENGAETRLEYVGLGYLGRCIHADGQQVAYEYDTEEQLVGVTNQRGERHRWIRDGLGRVTEEVDFWGQSRWYGYTPSGHLQSSIDSLGRRISYVTDPLGRIIVKKLPDGSVETFAYDGNDNVIEARNRHSVVTRVFDAEGRLLEEAQGAFHITNSYDEGGNRMTRQTSFGNTVAYAFDAMDRLVSAQVNDEVPVRIDRDARGRIGREMLGRKLTRDFRYNVNGCITDQAVSESGTVLFGTAFAYDAACHVIGRRDTEYGTERFVYDPVGRVTEHLDARGRIVRYLNDAAGDRLITRIVERAPARVVGETPLEAEWSREGEYEGTYFRFDRAGNLVERRAGARSLSLRWDANQRLAECQVNGASTEYAYDPFGRRLFKQVGGRRTMFYWDGSALIGESVLEEAPTNEASAAAGSVVSLAEYRAVHVEVPGREREYVYYPETFTPLFLIDSNATKKALYWFQTDPNGLPTRITDADGRVKWAARFSPWGDLVELYVAEIENQLRLQGQYADAESGLHYNRFRYYDAPLGSFISQDPLSVFGSENVYEYARNALEWVDPLGLKKCRINKGTIARLGEAPSHITNAHMHHIVMEGAFTGWTKENRKLVTEARSLLKKHKISLQGDANVVWAQNAGHSVEYAQKVLTELQEASPLGRQAVVDKLADIGDRLGRGTFI